MRTSPTHYVAPAAIAITPNANNSYNDLAVYIAPNTRIKVFCPRLGIGNADGTFREWILSGKNRRLAESTRPYTIYARLSKINYEDGYLVFAPKQQYNGEWYDKYSCITKDGLSISFVEGIDGRIPAAVDDPNYWYVKMGEVSQPNSMTNQRTVDLDTGILGTDFWNTEFALNPDALPLRIDMKYLLGNIVGDEWTAVTKYVRWEQVLHVNAKLVEGWTGTDITRFHHWEITRNTGSDADKTWNEAHDGQGSDSGNYTSTEFDLYLVHARGSGDDFNGVMQALFTFTAYEQNPDYTPDSGLPPYLPLTSMAFTVLAETIETFELEENSSTVTYNPQSGKYVPEIEYDDRTQEYSSESGTTVRVKATNADKETFYPTDEQIEAIGLHVYYRPVDDDNAPTELDLVNGRGVLPSAPFLEGKSVDVWLQVGEWQPEEPEEEDSNIILSRKTITYIRDGVSTPNCIVERQVVFIPTDSDGYVTEDCEVRVPFRVMMGNRRLAISGATITEDSDSRYATLNGGAIQDITGTKITVVGHKAIMQDATVEGHKAILGSSYVAGPQAVAIKVSKGVKIDEHLVSLTVTGVDSDGTEYETYAGIEIVGNAAGSAGEDAKGREWIYKRSDSQPETPANPEDRTTDDYIPAGWSDRPSGVDSNNMTEWTSWRDYDKGSQQWGDFRQPAIWSHFGRNGQDGDGTEYVFIRTKNNIAPVMDDVQEGYESDEFRPTITPESQTASQTEQAQTTDDPNGTDKTYKYEWVAKRSMGAPDPVTGARVWTKFTGAGGDYKMSLWSTFAESITKVSETPYYIKNKTGERPAENDPDWSETKPATLDEGEWLFTKTVITWSDSSKTVLYSSERNPNDGKAGQDIIVDGATVMKYYVSENNAQHPADDSSDWKDYSQITLVKGWWLWAQAKTNYKRAEDGSAAGSSYNYNVSYIGTDGEDGKDGKDGRSIVSITEYYKASANASGETAPSDDSGWSTNPNTAMSSWNEANKYLWNYEKITYSSGVTVERTTPQILAIWTKDGAAGKGIDSITNYYKVTDSNVAPSRDDKGWTTTPQAPGQGQYLWNYEKIIWLNPAGTTYTDVQQIGYAGTDGKSITVDASKSKTEYAVSQQGTDSSRVSGWSENIPTVPQGQYLWTRITTVFSDDSQTVSYGVSYNAEDGTSVSIVSESVTYAVTKDGNQPADSAFTYQDIPPLSLGDYLWTKAEVHYSDSTTTKSYNVSRLGTDGEEGQPGTDGMTTHFAYAKLKAGQVIPISGKITTDMVEQWSRSVFEGADIIGTYKDREDEDSTNINDYTWTKWKGEDGANGTSAASCFLDKSAVFVPVDTDGYVIDDFEAFVHFSVYCGTAPITAKSAQVDEGGHQQYIELTGGKMTDMTGTVITVNNHTAIISEGASVSGHKVTLTGNYVTSPNALRVRVQRGWQIDEHVATLQVIAEDSDGNEYLCRTPISIQREVIAKDGKDGKDGTSITKKGPDTIEYVLSTDGVNPKQGESWSTTRPTPAQGEYVLVRTTVHWSDDTTTVLISSERNPNDGQPGQDIIVDGATVMKYAVSDSNAVQPTQWSDYDAIKSQIVPGKWLWSQATTNYKKADGSGSAGSSVNYNVSYIGINGANGRAITATSEHYNVSDSSSTQWNVPASGDWANEWTTNPNVPDQQGKTQWNQNKRYLWNYEKITYQESNGNTTINRTIPRVVAIWTKDGKGIDTIVNWYAINNDPLTVPTTGWDDDAMPPTPANPYLWNYEVVTWTDGASTGGIEYAHVIGHYGKDGISVLAQYSANGTNWHSSFQSGDKWMRTSSDGGTTWTAAAKIVGENGSETDYSFGISQYKTTDNAQTRPADIEIWSDAPMDVTSAKPYLWSRVVKKNGSGTVSSTSYIRLTGEDGADAQYIYLKGTARDVDGTITDTIPCEVKVNGGTSLVAAQSRGLNLVTINRQTLARVESINYDTYGEAAGESEKRGITDLIAKLNSLDDSVFVCLVSFDAIGWQRPADVTAGTYPLITALQDYGMGDLPYTATGRYPFLFIGYKNLGKGNGLTRMRNLGAYTDVAELAVYVANGALTVKDGKDDYKINFTDPTFALDPNTGKNVVSIKGAVYRNNTKVTNITAANFAMRFKNSDGTVRELSSGSDFGVQDNEFVTYFGNGETTLDGYKTFVVDYKPAGTVLTQNSLALTVYGEKGMDAISGYADYLYSKDDAGNNRPAASASQLGKIDLLSYNSSSQDRIAICERSGSSYIWKGYGKSTYPDGTMFVCRVDNHIYRASANGWQDEGRFKGDNAVVYKIEFTDSTFAYNPNTARNIVDIRGVVYKIDGGNTSVFASLGTDSSLELYFLKTNPVSGQPPIQEQIPANLITISNGAFSTNSQDGASDRGEMAMLAIVKIGTGSNAKEVTRANIPRGLYGTDGSRGKRGRSYYYAQPWQDNPNVSYLVNDSIAPYFYFEDDGEYYVYNPVGDVNDSISMHDMGTPDTSNPNWEKMQSKFKYLITEAIFGSFAKFGSAIISGDWMISTNGTIDGKAYNNGALYNNSAAYTWFDPQYPNKSVNTTHSVNGEEWTGYNFVPNYAVDLLTGATYQQNAYITNGVFVDRVDIEDRRTWQPKDTWTGGSQPLPKEYKFYQVEKGDELFTVSKSSQGGSIEETYYDVSSIKLKSNHLFIYASGMEDAGTEHYSPTEALKATLKIILPPPQYFVGQSLVITNKSTGFPSGTLLLEQAYVEDIESHLSNWGQDHICMTIKELLVDYPNYAYPADSPTQHNYKDGEPVLTEGIWSEIYIDGSGQIQQVRQRYVVNDFYSVCGIWKLHESQTGTPYPEVLNNIDLNEYDWLELTAVAGKPEEWFSFITHQLSVSPECIKNNFSDLYASWMITRWEKKSTS